MASDRVVFLFDVDNTLLDNDRVIADLRNHLEHDVGHEREERYWALSEELRTELGYVDYLGALQRYRMKYPRDLHILAVSTFLVNYPFANRLYPGSIDVIDKVREHGTPALLSDGDVVFQPRKIQRSGLAEAVAGNVMIYIHKELELEDVEQRYPADHYVMFDDKLRILAAMKDVWRDRLTTVFPRQGHYARDQKEVAKYPPADVTVERIGEVVDMDIKSLVASSKRH